MNVAVLGGRGFFGGRVVALLETAGYAATVAGRSGGPGTLRVDLNRPETLAALDDVDVVINCSDSLAASPLALIERRLERGGILIEGTAAFHVVDAVLERWRGGETPPVCRGTVLLGMGVAPGLSNLLAADLQRAAPNERLAIGMRVSSFSGGGGGMASLMAEALSQDAVYFERGQRLVEPAASVVTALPFEDDRALGLRIALPESLMLRRSLGLAGVSTYLVPEPQLVRYAVAGLARIMRPGFVGPVAALLEFQRSILLGHVVGSMRLCAVGSEQAAWLRAPDGMKTAAAALVASVDALRGSPAGVVLPDERFVLQDMLERIRALGCEVVQKKGAF